MVCVGTGPLTITSVKSKSSWGVARQWPTTCAASSPLTALRLNSTFLLEGFAVLKTLYAPSTSHSRAATDGSGIARGSLPPLQPIGMDTIFRVGKSCPYRCSCSSRRRQTNFLTLPDCRCGVDSPRLRGDDHRRGRRSPRKGDWFPACAGMTEQAQGDWFPACAGMTGEASGVRKVRGRGGASFPRRREPGISSVSVFAGMTEQTSGVRKAREHGGASFPRRREPSISSVPVCAGMTPRNDLRVATSDSRPRFRHIIRSYAISRRLNIGAKRNQPNIPRISPIFRAAAVDL